MWWDIPAARSYATQREELADLRCRAQMLTQELETVQKRIAELAEGVDRTLDG
jgi:prefoldin subunit 5